MCTENCDCGCGSGMYVPRDSKITFRINREDPTNLCITAKVKPPLGYIYAGYDEEEVFYMTGSDPECEITCKCTDRGEGNLGSCDPTLTNGKLSCFRDSLCVACETTSSAKIDATTTIEFANGGFLNLGIPVSFIDNEILQLPAAFKAMYEIPEVVAKLNAFLTKIYRGAPIPSAFNGGTYLAAPDGYSYIMINLCGRATAIIVPNTIFHSDIYGAKESTSAAAFTCKCSSEQGSCPPQEYSGTSNGQCFGDCAQKGFSCTMKICKFLPDGGIREVSQAEGFMF